MNKKPKTFKCPHCEETCRKEYWCGREVVTSYREIKQNRWTKSDWYNHTCKFPGENKDE